MVGKIKINIGNIILEAEDTVLEIRSFVRTAVVYCEYSGEFIPVSELSVNPPFTCML